MLSCGYLTHPYPSYPALCRQGTTCAWSADYGGPHLRGAWPIWNACKVGMMVILLEMMMTLIVVLLTWVMVMVAVVVVVVVAVVVVKW